ncbi:hypothetical protein JMJ55_03845 [Belnapia sp. T6]|uniref:Uncharacterized protein n=1 Tax=Belnapia mucosa TaxID=2804532 RepID=A0ABS1UY94_9PROT|nr:hypothetical protein [Belnapia mucosa]MBL6454443.1 hypothetical protein [Belnapia mucosa]
MIRRHMILLALPVLAGCAQMGGQAEPPASAAARFAATLVSAEQAVDDAVARMDGFERMAQREDQAIAFALSGRTAPPARFTAPPAAAAEAAGRVLAPVFAALGDYAHALASVAAGQPVRAGGDPGGRALSEATANGLAAVQAASGTPVLEPVKTAGLAGVAALADVPARIAASGKPSLGALVNEQQPHMVAVVALLRAVIGPEPGQGTRGAIRARREGLDAQQARFLSALRTDGRIGPAERYSIFRSVSESRDNDPAQGNFSAIIDLLAALEQAHGALAVDGPDAEAQIAAMAAAVERLEDLTEGSRRG